MTPQQEATAWQLAGYLRAVLERGGIALEYREDILAYVKALEAEGTPDD